MRTTQKSSPETGSSSAFKDLIVIALVLVFVLVLSYFFNVFIFLVELFNKYPHAITFIDEIIVGLLTLSLGLAVFSWRRWRELKKATDQRIKLQEELISLANTKTETERIISKQLQNEIDLRRRLERNIPGDHKKTE